MTAGARTPEELDTLLEDAFVLRDWALTDALFDDHALLVGSGGLQARGGEAIAAALTELWRRDRIYVVRPGQVLRARDTALLVSAGAVHVLHRGRDGTWRAAISLLQLDTFDTTGGPMTQDTQMLAPALTRSGEGEPRWWFQCLAEIKLTAEQTGGQFSIVEITEPPNAAAPLHVHHREDETFWILEGDVTLHIGDETIEAHAATSRSARAGSPTATASETPAAACCSS